jgi:hypothetical protein
MYLNKSTIFRLEKDSTPKSIKWLSKQFQKTKELSEYVSRGGGRGEIPLHLNNIINKKSQGEEA